MIKVDAYFLFQVGAAIHPISSLGQNWTKGQVRSQLWSASYWLNVLLNNSVYRLTTCRISGNQLLETMERIKSDYEKEGVNLNEQVEFLDHHFLSTQGKEFETILGAEMQWGQLYLVQPKGGFDLSQLTENGIVIFPRALATKAPEAIADATEAARCIAFELPTAAAFHMHRVNELVLRRYYDKVTNGAARPTSRNIGAYMDALKNNGVKDPKLFGALANLKNFHRNPVLHPDDRLETVDDAISLLGAIQTVLTYMLKELPPPQLVLEPSPSEKPAIQTQETKLIASTTNAV